MSLVDAAASPAASTPAAAPRRGRKCKQRRRDDKTSTSTSPAQTCFSDGLHSIFSFLTLHEFVIASRICRSWSDAGSTQPPLRLWSKASPSKLEAMTHSHLARHIGHLTLSCFSREAWSSLSLCCRLPHLTSLTLDVGDGPWSRRQEHPSKWWGIDENRTTMQMPSTLRELEVVLCSHHFHFMEWELIDTLLARLLHSQTPPLTVLRLSMSPKSRPSIALTTQIQVDTVKRLLVLRDSLTELSIAYQKPHFADERWVDRESPIGPARWTRHHIDVFRQMARLEKLDPFNGRWSDEELMMLAAEPAPAHLRILPLAAPPITTAGADALVRLRLTKIDFGRAREDVVEDFSFLRRMSTLEVIRIGDIFKSNPVSPAVVEPLVDTLAECARCTELTISPTWATNADLCRLLPSLTHLRKLSVDTSWPRRSRFGGLTFASSVPHLAHTLEELYLTLRGPMPISELDHLHALGNLRSLVMSLTVPDETPPADRERVVGEFDTRQAKTFRRDLWPHMVQAWVDIQSI